MRKSPEERKAALERQIAAKKQIIRRIDKRETDKARRDRAHVGIVTGWGIIDYAEQYPQSEGCRVPIGILRDHLRERENDQPVADLLTRLTALADQREAAE
jgi:hypothetical protein